MHGIVSLLDETHSQAIWTLWSELEQQCGLVGVKVTPIPHFSWMLAEDFDLVRLRPALEAIARETAPFSARTTGLGLFTGSAPVLYIPLVRTAQLSALHQRIWNALVGLSVQPNPYYTPEMWMPHITLAHADLTPETMPCAVKRLPFQSYNWEIAVDCLAFAYQRVEELTTAADVLYKLPLQGEPGMENHA